MSLLDDAAFLTTERPAPPPSTLSAAVLQRDDLLAPLRGPSSVMAQLWSQVKVVAPHFRSLLLTGEPGCAQESVVHLLHLLSPFHDGPLLVLNPVKAGHQLQNPKRLLQSVAGGVLYLPDVDRLVPEAQNDLLRWMRMNRHHLCSLVASSTCDLRVAVLTQGFSAALAEELGSFRLAVPTLRERNEDVPLLAELFFREAQSLLLPESSRCVLAGGFLERALALDWPGNLDQLRSVMRRVADAQAKRSEEGQHDASVYLEAADLELALRLEARTDPLSAPATAIRLVKLEQVMQEHIRSVLIACQGNKLRAAEVLGISRSTLYRMLEVSSPASVPMLVERNAA